DEDGLPHVGRLVSEGDIICAWHTVTPDYNGKLVNLDGVTHYGKYKESETGFVEDVRVSGAETGTEPLQTISIKRRIRRPHIIGDKFSSRHGEKGVGTQKWAAEDMPASLARIKADISINPPAIPARMTIGMFVKSLAH